MLKLVVKLAGFLYIIFNLIFLFFKFDAIQLGTEEFLSKKNCPFCYGISICHELELNNINSRLYDFVFDNENDLLNTYHLKKLFNIKNVYFIKDNFSNKKFLLKKLAHDSELEDFDIKEVNCLENYACLNDFIQSNKAHLINQRINSTFLKINYKVLNIESVKCFTDRILNLIYKNKFNSKDSENYFDKNVMLLTTLKINPEPLILQVYFKLFFNNKMS